MSSCGRKGCLALPVQSVPCSLAGCDFTIHRCAEHEVKDKGVRALLDKHDRCHKITRSIRLRLISPVDARWEDVGPSMHAMRYAAPRLLQAAILEEIAAANGKRKTDTTAVIRMEMDAIRKHTGNDATRALDLSSQVIDYVRTRAQSQAGRYLRDRFKDSMRIPSESSPGPIYVRDGSWAVRVNGKLTLDVKLDAGRVPRRTFVCAPLKGEHWGIIRAVANGDPDHKPGDIKLIYDKRKDRKTNRKRGWEAIVTVTSPRPLPRKGVGTIAVHRGARHLLTIVSSDGGCWYIHGHALREQKRRLKARRRNVQESRNEMGSRGKGSARRAIDSLMDKENRVVRTACQQAGARVVEMVVKRGAAIVVREDYGGIEHANDGSERYFEHFPYYQLGAAIDWACRKDGVEVSLVPAEYVSTTCPRCGCADERQHNAVTGMFHCVGCGFDRDADFVAALNMLARSGADLSVWEERFRAADALADAMSPNDGDEPPLL